MNTGIIRSEIYWGGGVLPGGTFRFKKIDGSFWNGETFRFADYIHKTISVDLSDFQDYNRYSDSPLFLNTGSLSFP
nr:MAG TPA: hypothetical protein [Bacteriophage sp.]